MPLLALVDDDRTVSTQLSAQEWIDLQGDVRARRRMVRMQPCQAPGTARTSKLGLQFFAHKAGHSDCGTEHPGESPLHLAAKAEILRGCADAGWQAEPEHRGDGWVADVLATNDRWKLAFEVQVSQQVHSEYARRQDRYRDSGVRGAWFVKHAASVLPPNEALPTFLLEQAEDGLVAHLGHTALPLRAATAKLVSGQAPYRSHVSSGQLSNLQVWIHPSDPCWKCRKQAWLWRVDREIVTGMCGLVADAELHYLDARTWAKDKPEAQPAVIATVQQAIAGDPLPQAVIGRRFSKTAGDTYMAFSCPHCNALNGDAFLLAFWQALAYEQPARTVTTAGTVRGARHPHYCVDVGAGSCLKPPAAVLEQEAAAAAAREAHNQVPSESGPSVSIEVVTDVRSAVRRMFGGGSYGG